VVRASAASSWPELKHGHSRCPVCGRRETGGPRADDGSRMGQRVALRTCPQTQAAAPVDRPARIRALEQSPPGLATCRSRCGR